MFRCLSVLAFLSISIAFADSELIPPPLPIPVDREPVSSRLIDSYKLEQMTMEIDSDILRCEEAHGVCGNGWCTDFPVIPSVASLNWEFSDYVKLNHSHSASRLSLRGEASREDTLCQRVQGILEEANAANGEILVDINGYLSENIIRDMSGECLRILEEKIEVSMGNMQFSSDSYVILERGGACR